MNIKFKKQLSFRLTNDQTNRVLESVKEILKGKSLRERDIKIEDNKLSFDLPLFTVGRWNLFSFIDNGRFYINDRGDDTEVVYEISIIQFVGVSSVFAVIFGIISFSLYIGLAVLIWLGGVNIAIAYFRHEHFFKELISEINYVYVKELEL